MIKKIALFSFVSGLLLSMSGCNKDEPSEIDMQQALQEYLLSQLGSNAPYKVEAVEKQSCKKIEESPPSYTCEIAMTMSTDGSKIVGGSSTTRKDTKTDTFVKQDGKWIFDADRSKQSNSLPKLDAAPEIIEVEHTLIPTTEARDLAIQSITASVTETQQVLAIDILGLHLGMTPDESVKIARNNIKDSAAIVYKGNLKMEEFTSEPMVFGAKITRNIDNWGAAEDIGLVFSTKPKNELIFITRRKNFEAPDEETMLISTLKNSLIEKYGQPSYEKKFEGVSLMVTHNMYWVYEPSIKIESDPSLGHQIFGLGARDQPCGPDPSITLLEMEGASEAQTTFYFDGDIKKSMTHKSKCGAWLKVSIRSSQKDAQLAAWLFVAFGDYKELGESYLYAMNVLEKGAAEIAAAKRANAAENKPQL
jgi:hypothetical protein